MARKQKLGVPLDPEATRESILNAALTLLAARGPEGVSFSEVARLANVDRGTAHRHFLNREELLKATAKLVSDQLHASVFGAFGQQSSPILRSADIMEQNSRLLTFGMNNPELCRVWLFEVLSSDEPSADPFWRALETSYRTFAQTEYAEPNLNSEVLAINMLASAFLWPIWVKAHAKSDRQRAALRKSFFDECLRLAMYGSLKAKHFPEIEDYLKANGSGNAKNGAPAKKAGATRKKAATVV